jgi:hypothetical protein
MADQKGLDFLRAILGNQDQNTGLPVFTNSINASVPPAVDGNSPMTPQDLQSIAPKQEAPAVPVVAPAAAKQAPMSSVKEAFQATQSPEQKQAAEKLADSQNPLVDTQMQAALAQAKEQAETNQRRKALFEMMAGIGSLGGSKMSAESEALDNAIKMQNAPVDQINQERDAYKKFLANKEEMEKADPNSAVSKTMRDALSGMGVKIPDNASYATMENLAPQLMKNKEFQMRLQEMQLRREEMRQNKELAKDSRMSDKQNSYLQFATSKTAPIRAAYSKIQSAAKLAQSATNNPAEDITTLYSFVKNLDPESAVREGEVGLARDIASVQGKISTYFNKVQSGDSLDKKTVDNLKKEIVRLANSQKESYDAEMGVYKSGAINRGIPEERFSEFDPYSNKNSTQSAQPKTNISKDVLDYYNEHKNTFKSPEEAEAYLKRTGQL